ncbi:MAG: SAM-dependent methyltransferase [Sphingomonadales bacterium 32-68-7]|nr:MAG: SAM-dependent methyltransferase [Sphingomonadales bacterium 32-68-7]
MSLLDQALRRTIRQGELTIVEPGGTRRTYGAADPSREPVVVRLTDSRIAGQLARNPRLGLGEAYMDGRIVFEQGDILALVDLVTGNLRWEDGHVGGTFVRDRWNRMRGWLAARNHEARARANVAHHYDLGNELYRLFLDEDLQYSCAYYAREDDSLEQAQHDKKAHIAAKMYLKPGMKVLDIGCGWGGLALYLNQAAGVEVTGVTLSEQQLPLARERAQQAGVADRVRFELADYRRLTGTYDRVVSVGMFEHVGARQYRTFFARCRDLLAADGVMLLHTVGRFDEPSAGDPFADRYIFPGYHLPNLSQTVRAIEQSRLIVSDVETLRLHYALTLREWLRRTRTEKAALIQLYDERFVRMWEYYLAGAISMFENGAGCNFQVQIVRDRRALPIARDWMFEAERRYRDGNAPLSPAPHRAAAQ